MTIGKLTFAAAAATGAVFAGAGAAEAATVPVGNFSFESPAVADASPFASPFVDVWTQTGAFTQTGIFYNTAKATRPPPSPPGILIPPVQNVDGTQLGFVFAQTDDVTDRPGFRQDLAQGASPITYQVGQSYRLTVGVQGGGGGMTLNTPLNFQLYYVDPTITAGDNRVTIASATYRNNNATGQIVALADTSADLPTVTAGQAWANRQVGVRIVQPADPTVSEAGYFDLDNVRLTAVPEPAAAGLLGAVAGAGLLRRGRPRRP